MFITFEGLDGVGKTTQAKKLAEYFKSKNKDVVLTREPGGTDFGNKIREFLLSGTGVEEAMSEYLLFLAARLEHVEALIKPSLNAGKIVICDRFQDSSLVYQGILKGLNLEQMDRLYTAVLGNFKPEITILMDMEPKEAISRLNSRTQSSNHYDEMELESRDKVRLGFLKIAERDAKRYRTINANSSEDSVFQEILQIFDKIHSLNA